MVSLVIGLIKADPLVELNGYTERFEGLDDKSLESLQLNSLLNLAVLMAELVNVEFD